QSHVKDRFNRNESVRSSKEKKEVIKQIYRIKKDGRECVVSDLISNNKEPVKLTLATKGEEMKDQIAKSEITKKVPKIKKELPLCKEKSQPGCTLGLSSWQERKLQRLSAEELKKKNMACVPKDKHKDNSDVQALVARRATKVKKGNNKSNKQFSRRFVSLRQDLRLAHPPYSLNIPLVPLPWTSSPGMIGNPSWIYWDPWMHHNSLYHERGTLQRKFI
ncbi:hypothetical protein BRADI_3g09996v3, partial [Brachypodium distachyon]